MMLHDDTTVVEPIGARELEILALLAEGHTNQEVADRLVLSLNTVKWYARQIYGKLGVSNRREAVQRAKQLGLLGKPEAEAKAIPHNLPSQITPFMGRHRDLAELRGLLLDPDCRLVTIIGPGGMGKTRLALEAASQLVADSHAPFNDGVFLVSLVDINDAISFVSAIADAIHFRFYQATASPQQQLISFLQRRQTLLLLDNFEHLIDQETLDIVIGLLSEAPKVTVVTTSRVRLNINGEQVYVLSGLDVPTKRQETLEVAAKSSSIQLYSAAARRANPDFILTPGNCSPVIEICRLVEGMPLAIELAATWTEVLNPGEILREIRDGLAFLASDAANIPDRHRSLPVVLDASWRLLDEAERESIKSLSICRGGFSRAAARAVAGVSSETLLGLVRKSWLQREPSGRYRVQELLRQYGVDKLAEDAENESTVRTRHSQYFCRWLAGPDVDLRQPDQLAKLNAITIELENAHAACMWAACNGLFSQLDRAIDALGLYHRWQSGFASGDRVFALIAEKLTDVTESAGLLALAQISKWRCLFRFFLGDERGSQQIMDEVLALINTAGLEGSETRAIEAVIESQRGYIKLVGYGSPAEAMPHFVRGYELSEAIGDSLAMSEALVGQGKSFRELYLAPEAESVLRQSIQLHERTGNQLGYSDAVVTLGSVAFWRGRFAEAEQLFSRGLSVVLPDDQEAMAHAQYWLGRTYHDTGRLVEAAATMDDCLASRKDQGLRLYAVLVAVRCGMIYRDLGEFAKARKYLEDALVDSRESDYQIGIGRALYVLGAIDLLEGDIQGAYERLKRGLDILLNSLATSSDFTTHRAWLGFTARALGRYDEAWRYALAELHLALDFRLYPSVLSALACVALLQADAGQETEALALVALLAEHPYLAKAQWFKRLIVPDVKSAVISLSREERQSAEDRGRRLDLWRAAARLHQDLRDRQ